MQALILAAGRGSRLGKGSDDRPKCLVPVAGRTLIDYQLSCLRALGIRDIGIVVGYRKDVLVEHLDTRGVTLIENHDYATTNSVYSLWLAREWVRGPFMLLNCDVFAHPAVYYRVARAQGSALAYDKSSGDEEEHMKVQFSGGRLSAISKKLASADGENVGVLKFDEDGARSLFAAAHEIVKENRVNDWAPAAVHRAAASVEVRGLDISDLPWTEIDFAEDVDRANRVVWPAIFASSSHHLDHEDHHDSVHWLRTRSLRLLPEAI